MNTDEYEANRYRQRVRAENFFEMVSVTLSILMLAGLFLAEVAYDYYYVNALVNP